MSDKTFTIQGVSGASVSSVEDYDNDEFNFFRVSAHGSARPARVVVDPSKLISDAIYQHAFLRFADNSLPLLSAHALGDLPQLVQRTSADVIRFEVPMSGDRYTKAEIYDSTPYNFLERTDRSVVVSGKSYQVAVVMVDLGRYFADGQYRKGFDEFRSKLEAHYVDELAKKGQTVDSLPPALRPLQNFVRFLRFPAVRQTVAVIPAYAEEVKKFGLFFTALNIPEGNRVLVSFQIDPAKLGDQSYRSALFAAATHMANWTDARLRAAGKTLDDPSIPIDSRNLSQLLSALRAYGVADARGSALLAGAFGADAGQTAARLLGDSGVDPATAFEGATNATTTQGSLPPMHKGAPPPSEAATIGALPSFRHDEPAAAARPTTPTPPPKLSAHEEIAKSIRDAYPKGGRTRGDLEITENNVATEGSQILIVGRIYAKRKPDGAPVEIVPKTHRINFPKDYYKTRMKALLAKGGPRLLADVISGILKRNDKAQWSLTVTVAVTVSRDGTVSAKIRKVSGSIPAGENQAGIVENLRQKMEKMHWPVDDREDAVITIMPITLTPPSQ